METGAASRLLVAATIVSIVVAPSSTNSSVSLKNRTESA